MKRTKSIILCFILFVSLFFSCTDSSNSNSDSSSPISDPTPTPPLYAACGDGIVQSDQGEECDTGGLSDPHCSSECKYIP